ncbi:MAG: hypothetical protein ACKVU4_09895 [Phycisphaerales bacterium]
MSRTNRRGVVLVDAIVGSLLLGVVLAVILGLAGRSLTAQMRGEELRTAAMLLDEQLNLVLMRGPDEYASRFDSEGPCDAPFNRYSYRLDITDGQSGAPYRVRATVSWVSGGRTRAESVETCMAPRLGDDPDPERRPEEAVDRWE